MTAATLVHSYRPRGSCADLFTDRSPELVISGPAGTGKSRACLEKLHMMCLVNPGMRGLIVRKAASTLTSTALVTWREHVCTEALARGDVVFYGGSAEEPPQYRYANGSRVMIGGMDRATKIMSSEYDLIFVQEAIELHEADWEALSTRLRNGRVSFQQLLADTNPDSPLHWLRQRADRGDLRMIDSRHEDNPTLFDEAGKVTPDGAIYIARLDALTGPRHARLRKGLWTSAEGQIYDDWDPAVHVVDRFPVPKAWPRRWVVDFGYTNPFVLQWWAEDPDGRLFLYRELYRTKRLVEDHARDALAQVTKGGKWTEPRPSEIICDHDAEDRATLERHLGMTTRAARKEVSRGIQAVAARLRPAGDGRPRLFIMRDSVVGRDPELVDAKKPASTPEEIPGYVWDPGSRTQSTSAGKAVKEAPLKLDDHGVDAMRYLVAARDLGPQSAARAHSAASRRTASGSAIARSRPRRMRP